MKKYMNEILVKKMKSCQKARPVFLSFSTGSLPEGLANLINSIRSILSIRVSDIVGVIFCGDGFAVPSRRDAGTIAAQRVQTAPKGSLSYKSDHVSTLAELGGEELLVGNLASCRVTGKGVADRHASFRMDSETGQYLVRNLAESGATLVNGEALDAEQEKAIYNGDSIRLGDVDMTLCVFPAPKPGTQYGF